MRLVAVTFLLVAACSEPDEIARFVGQWQWQAGTRITGTCADGSTIDRDGAGETLRLYRDIHCDVVRGPDYGCQVCFDVDGATATARPGQACTTTGTTSSGGAYSVTGTFAGDVYTLDGDTLTESSTVTMIYSGAISTSCEVSFTGTAVRISSSPSAP